ncbi:hypothetical protein C2E23DRAFT_732936 [Lenzites betulinus]|nr:hypothetical protein C2E23DRAFT_732936 [Lenzites betulinus]
MPHTSHHHSPQPAQYDRESSTPSPADTHYYDSDRPLLPPLHPSTYAHPPVHSPPYVPPSPEKQYRPESNSRRYSPASRSTSDSRQSTSSSARPAATVPPQAARPCRVLTLLIEDRRSPEDDCFLAEVKVPLKPADSGDEGFWADAQDIAQELQKGPSRIDAKVYTMRGKYKQYFLRVTPEGEALSQSANLKITTDRTLEIVVEDVGIHSYPRLITPNPVMRRMSQLQASLDESTFTAHHRVLDIGLLLL